MPFDYNISRLFFLSVLSAVTLSCGDSKSERIIVKGDLENLPSGSVVLQAAKDSLWTTIDSTKVKNGTFEFDLSAAQYPEPIRVALSHYDADSVKRSISFETGAEKKAGFGGMEATSDFYLEDGTVLSGPVKVQDRGWYKTIIVERPIRAGRQSRVMYDDTAGFMVISSTDKLVGLIEQHPYAYYYLDNLKTRTAKFSNAQFYRLFNAFDQDVRESKSGRELKNYIDTRNQKARP